MRERDEREFWKACVWCAIAAGVRNSTAEVVKGATETADALLVEFRLRFPAPEER